ncbi:hypothetical protein GVN18_43000 [Pseudomonas sp. ODNR1LW]|nr:hypothetical protein [Pseudomonas sp. ODNR1LW]
MDSAPWAFADCDGVTPTGAMLGELGVMLGFGEASVDAGDWSSWITASV